MYKQKISEFCKRMFPPTIFNIYFWFNCIFGVVITVMNTFFAISLSSDSDPNPGEALYFLVLIPMFSAFLISSLVTLVLSIRKSENSFISLAPVFIWILSFLVFFI